MPICRRCNRHYKGDPDELCEPCEEHKRQVHRETYTQCEHCGTLFTAGAFDKHRWQIYHRIHTHPRGRKVRI